MQIISKYIFIVIITTITGCATTSTGPTSAGNNTYVISRQEGAFPSGTEPLLAEAIAEANVFCINQGRTMNLINTHENQGPYILFNYPKATVTFSCVQNSAVK